MRDIFARYWPFSLFSPWRFRYALLTRQLILTDTLIFIIYDDCLLIVSSLVSAVEHLMFDYADY